MLVPKVDLGEKNRKCLLNLQTFFRATTMQSLLNFSDLDALRSLQCLPRSCQRYRM